ncbi:MAG: exodeoxyribonuclease III, partial [Eubacteriales bacterium]|nr:exodeoxyribonuclease III [Eubacteriales bacterium]
MKIISWNVNGLQAAWGHGLPTFIEKQKADIYAFQETKRHTPFKPAEVTGYFAYWSCHNSHKGYSGTLCLTKAMPSSVQYEMGDEEFDCEGRLIVLEY